MGQCGLDSSDLGYGPMTGSCGDGNEFSDDKKCGELFL
jgi:hypothetical protein